MSNSSILRSADEDSERIISSLLKFSQQWRLWVQVIGMISNPLLLIVYQQSGLRKLSVSVYFQWQAVFCTALNIHYIQLFLAEDSYVENSEFLCKLVSFLLRIYTPMSVWFELAASVDRYFTIVFPVKFKLIQNSSFKRAVIVFILAYNIGLYSVILFDVKLVFYGRSSQPYCQSKFWELVYMFDLVSGLAVPFLLMTGLSILISTGVYQAHKRVRAFCFRKDSSIGKLRRDIKFAITMIVLNLVFLLMNVPYRLDVLVNINSFMSELGTFLFRMISNNIYESYYSIIFFVHLAVNSLVRREFVNMLKRFVCLFNLK